MKSRSLGWLNEGKSRRSGASAELHLGISASSSILIIHYVSTKVELKFRLSKSTSTTKHKELPKTTMPPKNQRVIAHTSRAGGSHSNYLTAAYRELTSPDNATLLRSIAMFGVSSRYSTVLTSASFRRANSCLWIQVTVAFLHSSWREFLLPG